MNRTKHLAAVAIATLLTLGTIAQGGQETDYYLVNNLKGLPGTITTDKGPQATTVSGQIAYRVDPDPKGGLSLRLIRMNLLCTSVATSKGHSGTIGLALDQPEVGATYDAKSGSVNTSYLPAGLHYRLLTDTLGNRRFVGKDQIHFMPYMERMSGSLMGQLPAGLQPSSDGSIMFKGQIDLALDESELGLIHNLYVSLSLELLWERLGMEPSEILRVQPVFIGTGPDDPTATGRAFDTLIRRAADMWNRCGTERCIAILCDPPIYLDHDDYRVIDNLDEFWRFSREVDMPGAIEVFVAERFEESLAVRTGSGGTYDSGTASSVIVTADQQLDVPCPAPCGYGSCGDVNYYHLAHELGHVLDLDHPNGEYGAAPSSWGSVMEGSGFCLDNPDAQSARNCRNASNPLLTWGRFLCTVSPYFLD